MDCVIIAEFWIFLIRFRLLSRENIVVTDIQFKIDERCNK